MGPTIKLSTKSNEWNKYNIKLPYLGPKSENLCKKLNNSIRHISSDEVKVNVILQQRKFSSLFNSKSRYPTESLSNVIYELSCMDCNAKYIGETKRRIKDRFIEHHMDRFGTQNGVLSQHSLQSGHKSGSFKDCCRILNYESNFKKRRIKESLLIKQNKPSLNENIRSLDLNLF